MASFARATSFGFMISDTSRGRVLPSPTGGPLVLYRLNRHDLGRIQAALVQLCEVYFAAGAQRLFPMVHGFDELTSLRDVEKLRRARLSASDLELMLFTRSHRPHGMSPATSWWGKTRRPMACATSSSSMAVRYLQL